MITFLVAGALLSCDPLVPVWRQHWSCADIERSQMIAPPAPKARKPRPEPTKVERPTPPTFPRDPSVYPPEEPRDPSVYPPEPKSNASEHNNRGGNNGRGGKERDGSKN